MDVQVVHNRVHALDGGRDPGLHLLQEVDPVGDGAAAIRGGQRFPTRGLERAEEVAAAPPTVIDLLARPLSSSPWMVRACAYKPRPREALGAFGAQLIQADGHTTRRRGRVEGDDGPLFSAKAGSTRSPYQVS